MNTKKVNVEDLWPGDVIYSAPFVYQVHSIVPKPHSSRCPDTYADLDVTIIASSPDAPWVGAGYHFGFEWDASVELVDG